MEAAQKQEVVSELTGLFGESAAGFLVDYQGCDCQSLTGVRNKLRETGAQFGIVKNTLAKLAVKGSELEGIGDFLTGPTAVVWAKEGIVEPAKVVADFAKEQTNFELKGGYVDGEIVGPDKIEALAKMPSKLELQAKLLSLLNAPAVQLLNMLNAPGTQLVRLLGAWRDELQKKEGE